ncbi:MAG: membrane integrity-associated transporter subunit PqiC [Deltaproteobacteria bacterium]|nr:membrane integrity-associated transporter subunit PqiC [Deltaproteobacteria bacterium]
MRRLASLAVLCAFVAAGAGCASPRSYFYTLNSAAMPATTGADYSVAVGPVSVPAAVDRPQIVVRLAPNQVGIDEFHRWASPLKDAISRVVAENLAAMLGTPHVTVFPQPTAAGAQYRVLVDVLRFESAPGEAASLDAVWTVRSAKDGSTRSGRTTVSEPVPDREYATLAAAHSRALGRLSADLAGAIQALSPAGG